MPKIGKKLARNPSVTLGGPSSPVTQITSRHPEDISGTLNQILNNLDDLSEKINQIDQRLVEVEERISESFDLAHENIKATVKILIETAIYPSEEEYKEAAKEYLSENWSEYYESLLDKRCVTYYKQNIAGPQTVKAMAKILIETAIYPSEEEYKEAAEEYLSEHQSEYFESLSDKRWATYYKQNIAGSHKLQKGEEFLSPASDEETSDEEVVKDVRKSRKKRRKSQPSKMTKRSKRDHASFTSSEQFHEISTTLANVQEIADDSKNHHDDSHNDP
ncbi:hypothetical protein C2G38_2196324 [Gigaspora rosea]|uniref:Uncharacterized protein n=1 Tax=Gigaspora rosea TaxID=44941 RepID=A0A397UW27_9GLOM|nr:hypothetical protein C2G38_2196324 [Gigaspora rosea]